MRQLRNQILVNNDADGYLYKLLDYKNIYRMRETLLHQLFYNMPKGGNIHLHFELTGNYSQLIDHLLENYRNQLYVIVKKYPEGLSFSLTFKKPENCTNPCKSINTLVEYSAKTHACDINAPDCRKKFSSYLLENCAIGPHRQNNLNQNGTTFAWTLFEDQFNVIDEPINLSNITEWLMRSIAIASSQENIDYLELRTILSKRYTLLGDKIKHLDLREELKLFKNGLNQANKFSKINKFSSVDATLIPTDRKNIKNLSESIKNVKTAWKLSKNDQKNVIFILRVISFKFA
jgi:hypothetical protein